jgi:hypothetical protein
MAQKYTHDELTGRVETPGWQLIRDKEHTVTGTLRYLLDLTHRSREKGTHLGLIREIETEIELDMLEVERLWRYLGLPV